jgi:hypothetical protein
MPAFVCDDHLGKLARLLRTLGYDTLWCRSGQDAEIVLASALGRVFVSRDSAWSEKTLPGPKLVVTESDSFGQLRTVMARLELSTDQEQLFSRCLECNSVMEKVEKNTVLQRLPPYIQRTQERIRRCPGCDRLYWEGTHVGAMREQLRREGILQ